MLLPFLIDPLAFYGRSMVINWHHRCRGIISEETIPIRGQADLHFHTLPDLNTNSTQKEKKEKQNKTKQGTTYLGMNNLFIGGVMIKKKRR